MTSRYPPLTWILKKFRPRHLKPDFQADSLLDVTDELLSKLGVEAVVFDVDNTLCPHGENQVAETLEKQFMKLTSNYPSCILSNTRAPDREKMIGENTGLKVISPGVRKPGGEAYQAALDYVGKKPSETVMVGDRLLTDIMGANIAGLKTVKVKPVDKKTEPLFIKATRIIEQFLSALFL